MTWVLVLYVYAGMLAKGDSVTLTTIEGFSSKASCTEAGKQSEALVSNSTKELRYVCVAKK
jgi:hypothetical protein